MRVIPAVDLFHACVVRLTRGDYNAVKVYSEDPCEVIKGFVEQGAQWLHLVDLESARDSDGWPSALLCKLLYSCRLRALRVQVGGGIRTLEQVRAYARDGASRVVIGTQALRDPDFVAMACEICTVVVAVDARNGNVAIEGWSVQTEVSAMDLAQRCVDLGAEAVLYTDIARDGTGEGPSVAATVALAQAVPGAEVIASGGIGSLDDLRALAQHPEIASVVVGRALYEKTFTLREALAVGTAR